MPELILLRHGKAEPLRDGFDMDRRLKNRGKREIQRIGTWLAQQSRTPDCVVTSPAERTRTSAEKCCKAMGLAAGGIQEDVRLYRARTSDLLACLHIQPDHCERLLLVGHNPGLEELSALLLGRPIKSIVTATALIFYSSRPWSQWSAGCAKLLKKQSGCDLPDGFPYPLELPKEKRPRPAYYYRQSSVIPYRMKKGKPQVLLILSSGGKRWVVPKGIVEPGLSPAESALIEAEEEAGAKGKVSGPALGTYVYEKWGAPIRVEVFAMEVSRLMDAPQWAESHRGRQWVSLAEAREQLAQKGLLALLDRLQERLAS